MGIFGAAASTKRYTGNYLSFPHYFSAAIAPNRSLSADIFGAFLGYPLFGKSYSSKHFVCFFQLVRKHNFIVVFI
jgi:hypothetical protein